MKLNGEVLNGLVGLCISSSSDRTKFNEYEANGCNAAETQVVW